jgi:hypothetical protein
VKKFACEITTASGIVDFYGLALPLQTSNRCVSPKSKARLTGVFEGQSSIVIVGFSRSALGAIRAALTREDADEAKPERY